MKVDTKKAIALLKAQDVVAVPTETVYGLAALANSEAALKKIFSTKQRPLFDPLIVHVLDSMQAQSLALFWPKEIDTLTKDFWPGPLTVVVPKTAEVNPLISSGLPTVGLRAPSHPIAREIISATGPFAAPSANKFGRTSPTRAEHVEQEFEGKVAVVDGGPSQVGVESTVVRWNDDDKVLEVLRPGHISQKQLANSLKRINGRAKVVRAESVASPGHLPYHYQPKLPLTLQPGPMTESARTEVAKALDINAEELYDLVLPPQAELAARELYHQLHLLSQKPTGAIVFWKGKEWDELSWEALRDRLERAAAPRK